MIINGFNIVSARYSERGLDENTLKQMHGIIWREVAAVIDSVGFTRTTQKRYFYFYQLAKSRKCCQVMGINPYHIH